MRLTEGGILVGVALLVLFAAWIQVGALWCFRLGHWFLSSGRRNAVRRVAWCLDFVPWRRGEYSAAYLRIRVASDEGQTSVALQRLEEMLQKLTHWRRRATSGDSHNTGAQPCPPPPEVRRVAQQPA